MLNKFDAQSSLHSLYSDCGWIGIRLMFYFWYRNAGRKFAYLPSDCYAVELADKNEWLAVIQWDFSVR